MLLAYKNFAKSTCATAVTTGATSIILNAADGAKFPTLSNGRVFFITVKDAGETVKEICKVTGITGDIITVVRGQDGTVAQAWSAGSIIEMNVVAAILPDQSLNTTDDPTFNSIKFGTTPTVGTTVTGQLFYDAAEQTLSLDVGEALLQIGQEQYVRATNITGTTILNGKVVYISGASSSKPTIALARSNDTATSQKPIIGIVTEDIANNGVGNVTIEGHVHGLDTSAFSVGDLLYIDPSVAGSLTKNKPTYPNVCAIVGQVVVSNATTGVILVYPMLDQMDWVLGKLTTGAVTVAQATNAATAGTAAIANAIADGSVSTTSKLADGVVTFAKIVNVTTNKLIGRSTPGSGSVEEISVGSGLSLSGGVLATTGQIVTSVFGRTGAITLQSSDVTTALGFTPYNSTNPSGYISSVTWASVSGKPSNFVYNDGGNYSINIAGRGYPRRSDGADLNFSWSGQGGQPTWLWGGNDGANMYVYNPSNFSVAYAGNAGALGGWGLSVTSGANTVMGRGGSGETYANAFYYASDRNLKKDIEPIRDIPIELLNPVEFVWKESGRKDLGFIAQEIREHIPEATSESEGILNISLTPIVAVLVNEIKMLKAKVSALESK